MGDKNKSSCMITHTENCKECSYCVMNCPKKAISFSNVHNAKGYNTVVIDKDLCINCAVCYTVCPDYVFEKVEK